LSVPLRPPRSSSQSQGGRGRFERHRAAYTNTAPAADIAQPSAADDSHFLHEESSAAVVDEDEEIDEADVADEEDSQ
jgi:hypothetical protein